MKTAILALFVFFAVTAVAAQDRDADEKIYTVEELDSPPDFYGGIDAFYKIFRQHFVAPDVPGLVDKVVFSFVVEKDGSLTDIRIIHDAGFGTADQARKILEDAPKWRPGYKDKKTVRSLYLLPIAIITE